MGGFSPVRRHDSLDSFRCERDLQTLLLAFVDLLMVGKISLLFRNLLIDEI